MQRSKEGVKRSAETQTGTTPVKKQLSRLMDPLQVILTTEEQQTQTPTRRDFDEGAFSDVALALRSERPVWAASSTQTSPRIPDTCNSLIKDGLLPSDGVRLAESGNSSHTNSISTSTVKEGALQRPPKLADIEQFSTETQTDFVSQGVGESTDWDLSFEQFDAGTQFDLDDILCSNYTQTVMGTELDLAESHTSCHVADMINAVHSIETQTISDQISKAQSSMETQTVLEEFI
ncbi:hypothetical protein TCAL_16643 [Tigriopus californicus]|uniref:Uncharacterized protein n=1 Tax=Tigriopus californicus TaxID=6832 RepID=A0A553NDI8_TIGCA|nr:uncharacterized protein LOC131889427 [Tigriopus californicus]TRY63512.1 hypothetical protein TCAL_16643 [Tigriopus californicus]